MIEMNKLKWADYAIIAVKFKKEKRHIEKIKIREDTGDKLANEQTVLREEVVRAIENRTKFVTAYSRNNQWCKGDEVIIVEINYTKFIRTDGNRIEADNLGELPEFD